MAKKKEPAAKPAAKAKKLAKESPAVATAVAEATPVVEAPPPVEEAPVIEDKWARSKRLKAEKAAAKAEAALQTFIKAATDAPAVEATPAPEEPKGPKLVKGGKKGSAAADPSAPPINKRITPGAKTAEWRIARSSRIGKPGFFLQGGYIEPKDGRKFFRVAEEEYYTSLHEAKKALVAKLPEATPVGSSSEVG